MPPVGKTGHAASPHCTSMSVCDVHVLLKVMSLGVLPSPLSAAGGMIPGSDKCVSHKPANVTTAGQRKGTRTRINDPLRQE